MDFPNMLLGNLFELHILSDLQVNKKLNYFSKSSLRIGFQREGLFHPRILLYYQCIRCGQLSRIFLGKFRNSSLLGFLKRLPDILFELHTLCDLAVNI